MPNKAIFLDRDGTIIEDPGYINHPDQVKLQDGAAKALNDLRAMGYKLVIVSNQSAVARGIVTEEVLGDIHDRLRQLLAEKGAFLDKIFYCPYHPDGVILKYRKESDWRKPNPGMLLAAAKEMDIDLSQSWMIGNSSRDVEAGLMAGCKTILVEGPLHYKQLEPGQPKPDHKAVNIKEAVNIVKQFHRSANKPEPEIPPSRQGVGPAVVPTAVSQNEKIMYVEQLHRLETEEADIEPAVFIEVEEQTEPSELQAQKSPLEQEIHTNRTEQLLASILERLKSMQRADMFGEFSIMRFLANIIQVVVFFCLLLSIWFLMSPNRQNNAVFVSLGFAMVLQMMSLTLYIMQGRK